MWLVLNSTDMKNGIPQIKNRSHDSPVVPGSTTSSSLVTSCCLLFVFPLRAPSSRSKMSKYLLTSFSSKSVSRSSPDFTLLIKSTSDGDTRTCKALCTLSSLRISAGFILDTSLNLDRWSDGLSALSPFHWLFRCFDPSTCSLTMS